MVDMNIYNNNIDVDVYLKIRNIGDLSAFDIIQKHIEVSKKTPQGYTWWGNNQLLNPDKFKRLRQQGYSPNALIVVPSTSGGNNEIEYVAKIVDIIKYKKKGFPPDDLYPKYYHKEGYTSWFKLSEFKKTDNDFDIKQYRILANNEPLIIKLKSQLSFCYVYRMK